MNNKEQEAYTYNIANSENIVQSSRKQQVLSPFRPGFRSCLILQS